MAVMTRREAVKCAIGGLAVVAAGLEHNLTFASVSQDEITQSERDAMSRVASSFMNRFDVPGLSVAIAHSGNLAYQETFGMADRSTGEKVSTSHLFRIASVSKPVTATSIFSLVEKAKIRSVDKVFGENGILGKKYGTAPYRKYVEDITIDHLLTHTCGGWEKGHGDPMFISPKLDVQHLISWTLDNRSLENPPGKHWAYSNFGYCVLGRIIEAITQQTYRDYVQKEILAPSEIADMQIAGNARKDRTRNEVTYYGQNGENPYGMNVQRMDSDGGWLASPTDLVRFVTHVDGFTTTHNILEPRTIKAMTTHCDANEKYARGWDVNKRGNWWHTGSLPGTTSVMVRTASGFCWAALCNTRQQPSDFMNQALDRMVWDMAGVVYSWKL